MLKMAKNLNFIKTDLSEKMFTKFLMKKLSISSNLEDYSKQCLNNFVENIALINHEKVLNTNANGIEKLWFILDNFNFDIFLNFYVS